MKSNDGNEPADLLHLPGLRILRQHETDSQYVFEIETTEHKPGPCCDSLFKKLVKNGSKEQRFRDLPIHGKFVEVVIDRQRYACRSCRATVYEIVPNLADGHRMTERLMEQVAKRAAMDTFASIAREFGLAEGSIRGVFNEAIDNSLKEYNFEMPRVLGIDEKHLMGVYRCVIGNVEHRTLLDILPTRFQAHLNAYFASKSGNAKVEVVCQDMYEGYRQVARANFPKALVVVDKFHVVKMANEAVERIRRGINKDLPVKDRLNMKRYRTTLLSRYAKLDDRRKELLEEWFEQTPVLRQAFWCKEQFFDLYDNPTAADAQRVYRDWLKAMPVEVSAAFAPIPTAMKRWSGNIFGYFDHPCTNAYTESVNRLIGDFDRAGRGYSFEILRAKSLLSHGVFKVERPKFSRFSRPAGVVDFGTMEPEETGKNYGIPIDWLADALRSTPEAFQTAEDATIKST